MKKMIENTLRHMASSANVSLARISKQMGNHPNFLSASFAKGSVPRVDTFLKIAQITGYEVVLKGHNEEIVLVPPDQGEKPPPVKLYSDKL